MHFVGALRRRDSTGRRCRMLHSCCRSHRPRDSGRARRDGSGTPAVRPDSRRRRHQGHPFSRCRAWLDPYRRCHTRRSCSDRSSVTVRHVMAQLPSTHSKISRADKSVMGAGQREPQAPQFSRSVRRFTSHGKREFGHVVQPSGHLSEGQYDVRVAGASSVAVPASVGANSWAGAPESRPSPSESALEQDGARHASVSARAGPRVRSFNFESPWRFGDAVTSLG